jgi:hypothetical protein
MSLELEQPVAGAEEDAGEDLHGAARPLAD